MTAPATVLPTLDEAVLTLLEHLEWVDKGLDKPLTTTRIHALKQHVTVMRLTCLTPPLRPEGLEVEG